MFKYESEYGIVPHVGNQQWKFKFPNGFGASVIIGAMTYGGSEGKYELAVLMSTGKITYKTEITDDVIGYLTVDQVNDLLDQIASLDSDGKLPKVQGVNNV